MLYEGDDVLDCLDSRRRMNGNNSRGLYYAFMGDSRVRDVFTAFLNVTRRLEYSVNYEGVSTETPFRSSGYTLLRRL
jgi:hypothetical protein